MAINSQQYTVIVSAVSSRDFPSARIPWFCNGCPAAAFAWLQHERTCAVLLSQFTYCMFTARFYCDILFLRDLLLHPPAVQLMAPCARCQHRCSCSERQLQLATLCAECWDAYRVSPGRKAAGYSRCQSAMRTVAKPSAVQTSCLVTAGAGKLGCCHNRGDRNHGWHFLWI